MFSSSDLFLNILSLQSFYFFLPYCLYLSIGLWPFPQSLHDIQSRGFTGSSNIAGTAAAYHFNETTVESQFRLHENWWDDLPGSRQHLPIPSLTLNLKELGFYLKVIETIMLKSSTINILKFVAPTLRNITWLCTLRRLVTEWPPVYE